MKGGGGRYTPLDCEFDLDHEITNNVIELKSQLIFINNFNEKENSKAIKKAMIETLLNDL